VPAIWHSVKNVSLTDKPSVTSLSPFTLSLSLRSLTLTTDAAASLPGRRLAAPRHLHHRRAAPPCHRHTATVAASPQRAR
jgi:hypothetical protein